MYKHISPREELIKQAKELRKSVYKIDKTMHDKMPKKREKKGYLEYQIEYTKELLDLLKEDVRFTTMPKLVIRLLIHLSLDTKHISNGPRKNNYCEENNVKLFSQYKKNNQIKTK